MVMREVDKDLIQPLLPPMIQWVLVDHRVYSYSHDRSGHRSQTSQFSSYNHGKLKLSDPRFPREAIPRHLQGENTHQNHPYYYYQNISPHPHPRIPQHDHYNIPPHPYQKFQHIQFICFRILVLLLCMHLMYFQTTPKYND